MNMFNIAWSGLQAAQFGMSVTSMNISNVLTPGYSRQGIIQSSVVTMGQGGMSAGAGVQVDSIRRVSDQYLTNQVWQSNSKANYYGINNQYLGSLEKVIGTDSTSLGTGLDDFFSALSALTKEPESEANRQQLLNQADSLATRFNNMNDFINSQKTSISSQRDTMVGQINSLTAGIADYNKKIMEMDSTGGNSNVLRDQRDELVKQLSTYADVKVTEDSTGSYSVAMKNGQPLVSGKVAGELSSSLDGSGNPVLSLNFSNTTFSLNPSTGGQLGALYDYETGDLAEMQASVQGMAEAVATLFNDQLAQGFDKNGNKGQPLFTFDLTNPAGILQVNDLKPDELALSGKPDEQGNGDNLQLLIDLKNKKVDIGGMGNMSLNEGAAAIISNVGIASKKSQSELEAAQGVYDQAQLQRNNLSAVNQDEEAINLQIYMQAYQSNVKVIATGNQIFNDLLGLF
ncbi:flagellar hook-associated protein FlgK [Enterobacter huaxiensis]|jgi:flagellar hook-associated protein 1 FlgK|uniref:Flagellar hook-associated protein 1 n=1 Tax=Enterobacter huaxiensis TaxID=2494702 RepID=A0A428LHI5_9ENTR|nr:flagellar hook-associated protein FlgK [Enterobacter huaxiensis]MCS5451967.1 flagellar hook-associated protein FlgK [Enterobacter huaxiensis]MEB7544957.1 flagellar hook-associated protein FlgK [Enterobacter huaxiensis]MEB7583208.1 flagellar hook-associated protein FlgK [Enterobacter huaxiensis]MEB7665393.1 flagellar hook-associated protein FlgK [Enterobacter huaxiensis]RSK63467.1 flagellar hook-associated protein FlgK [Enterobacter huaxiensis]